jgi:tether containing UBX domain for GLUT4
LLIHVGSSETSSAKDRMASHVVVIATDFRRTTIKVNPGTYLSDVLIEACRKLGVSGDKYIFK